MKVFERYFERNSIYTPIDFSNSPQAIVVIPVLNDWDVFMTIDSLKKNCCHAGNIGVIIVVNHSEAAGEEVKQKNRLLLEELKAYCSVVNEEGVSVCFTIIEAFDLPAKVAGVGMARKLGMDAAAYFFYRNGKIGSPILSLDADTLVEDNYSDEVIRCFRTHPIAGVSIAYAHRYKECDSITALAMVKYELYLRYYQHALQYAGHPHAFHCIGSAFAVRTQDYVAQGGMNKRQAGEDFYFLQKLITTGRYATLQSTCVYPSARFSDRTPFGTGQAIRQIVAQGGVFPVYNFYAFRALQSFFQNIPNLYQADVADCKAYFSSQTEGIQLFLKEMDGQGLIAEAHANCASQIQFTRRFFTHFNALRVLKYLNFVHDSYYKKVDVSLAIADLCEAQNWHYDNDPYRCLEFLRTIRR